MYDNLKRTTAEKVAHNKRTGVPPKPYTDLDQIMMDIEGRDSNKMVGLGLPDDSSQFSSQSNQDMLNLSSQSDNFSPVFNHYIINTSQSETIPSVFINPSTTAGNVVVSVAGKHEV